MTAARWTWCTERRICLWVGGRSVACGSTVRNRFVVVPRNASSDARSRPSAAPIPRPAIGGTPRTPVGASSDCHVEAARGGQCGSAPCDRGPGIRGATPPYPKSHRVTPRWSGAGTFASPAAPATCQDELVTGADLPHPYLQPGDERTALVQRLDQYRAIASAALVNLKWEEASTRLLPATDPYDRGHRQASGMGRGSLVPGPAARRVDACIMGCARRRRP
jgi:hypothetical protein